MLARVRFEEKFSGASNVRRIAGLEIRRGRRNFISGSDLYVKLGSGIRSVWPFSSMAGSEYENRYRESEMREAAGVIMSRFSEKTS